MLKTQLKKEKTLLAELGVAKELGLSLGQLREQMTYQEVWLWCAYFGVLNDDQEERMRKTKSRRR